VPAGLSAAGALELAEGALQEGADGGELAKSGLAGGGVPVGGGRFSISYKYVIILIALGKKKVLLEEKSGGVKEGNRPLASELRGQPGKKWSSATRRISNSESPHGPDAQPRPSSNRTCGLFRTKCGAPHLIALCGQLGYVVPSGESIDSVGLFAFPDTT